MPLTEPPYHYQKLVRDKFLQGNNLVLQAPTGAGKTRAALEAGVAGFQKSAIEYPYRIIYNVPMRVLAKGFVNQYSERARLHRWDHSWYPTIQTGENPEDPLFEGRVVFATVDQMLASFLNIPYGLPKRLDNINTGAILGSYLIFDEFHLYPRQQMMLTVLAMLKMLRQTTRFILMSATFSPIFLQKIAYVLEAEAILADNYSNLFADVPSVQTQERTFFAETGQLSVETVLQRMGQRTLCICNTVDRAQALYKALKKSGTSVPCYLLHARFYREDRQKIELFVQDQFEHSTKPILLISTQAIEVGVDISSDVLLTECAPAASLIQRAGRCARRAGQQGIVYVFQPYDDKGEINYAPYKDNLRFAREHGRHCYLLNLMGKFCVLSRNNAS